MIRTYYHPGFAAPIGQHIMPMHKFALVAEALRREPSVELVEPSALDADDFALVHARSYIEAVQSGEPRLLAESQKFPWSPELYPSVRLTNGSVFAAAETALKDGYAAALASGFHHAHAERGEGFCTFNGLIVALELLKRAGRIKRAAILDMDLHYGNGTARLVAERPWLQALSIYGNDYWDNLAYRDVSLIRHEDGPNHVSAALPAGCNRATLLSTLARELPRLLEGGRPDILLYQAGADPFFEDPYSPLALDHADLEARDRAVFSFARQHGLPIAWVLAGGYTPDVRQVVQVHLNTFQAWREVYGAES